MQDTLSKTDFLKGGEFLIRDTPSTEQTFIPEEMNEEQLMIRDMVRDFMNSEILPNIERIEAQEEGLAPQLLEKMAELGLLGSHMPETYGGMQLDTNTNTMICDVFGPAAAFTVSYAAHTGIGMLPILYFGDESQKATYLPRLINGELKAAYCLTEPSSGSDALAAKLVLILTRKALTTSSMARRCGFLTPALLTSISFSPKSMVISSLVLSWSAILKA